MTTPNPTQTQADKESELSPNPVEVNLFHRYADTDTAPEALHHTTGPDANQASPGNHKHDGRDSVSLSAGVVTGSRGGNVALTNLLNALASKGFLTDSTTP